jgi:hypothetical protein
MSALDSYFVQDASRMVGDVARYRRSKGKLSALIEKEALPEGIGYNYTVPVSQRSAPSGGVTWTQVESFADGEGNNCTPPVTDIGWAVSLQNYVAYQALLRSERICFLDASRGYMGEKQVKDIQNNFMDQVFESWDDRDKDMYFLNAYNKVVNDDSYTTFEGTSDFGAVQATNRLTQAALDTLYAKLTNDGAGEDAYATDNGAPLYTVLMSQQRQSDLFNQDTTVRQTIEYATMGQGMSALLLQSWGVKRNMRGFMHLIDNRMPKYNWSGGAYVRVPFWINSAASNGPGPVSVPNPAYFTAQYEDVFIFHPKVMKRQMPKAPHSMGADTDFLNAPYDGEIIWRNIADGNPSSAEYNPMQDFGRYYAPMMAAYMPNLTRYGYILRVRACNNVTTSVCR